MSFLGGAECSTAANPLAQFHKQTSTDSSLQRDRLRQNNSPLAGAGFRSNSQLPSNEANAGFSEFLGQQNGAPLDQINDGGYLQQLHMAQQASRVESGAGQGWAGEFANAPQQMQHHHPSMAPAAFSPQDFAQFRQQSLGGVQSSSMAPSAFARPMFGSRLGFPGMQSQFGPAQHTGMGKSRVQELNDSDWEKQFEELSTSDQNSSTKEMDAAIERDLSSVDESMFNSVHFDQEYANWDDFENLGFGLDHSTTREANLGQYMFEENNLFNDVPNAFEEGQKIMREGGNLSLAALAFEAAVQKEPEHVEAWVALGQAQAQNEKEAPAIRALQQALKLEPDNLEALMALSVSYTNESYETLSYRTLERWISIKYPQLGVKPRGIEDEEMGFTEREKLHERVVELFLKAAQMNPEGNVDVDVQVGLGVLFYGSDEHEKAVDCFEAALNSHQHGSLKREGEEHLLWNRLGATLANSNQSEEAIQAYERALELRPNFVRARYNLGVSCINLRAFESAAGHLLGALSMHHVQESEGRAKAAELLGHGNGNNADAAAVENLLHHNQSTNLYETLRRVFTHMSRKDLAEKVGPDMDIDSLRGEFDF
ncbi:TPR-like protein [Piedraia hortae CBS 480.64]|uniref:Peroxisomal targeting signal receptor n=1 Tax=Piedraia hortae CBS 480.64 TaxID=1314780 RepID=A0A6A7BX92_9PEZI|nr:TPR-like protein [Piedraia hortae CBS 480.64]